MNGSYSGNDETGTLQQPYKSVQAAINVAMPGDFIYIMKGTYREEVRIGTSGITLQNYGMDTVVFNGCEPLYNWESLGNGVYKTIMNWDVTESDYTNQIFIDGKMMNIARWPKNISNDFFLDPTTALIDRIYKSGEDVKFEDNEFDEPAIRWLGAQVSINPSSTIYRLDGAGWSNFIYAIEGNTLTTRNMKVGREDDDWGAEKGSEYYLYNPLPEGVYATGGVTSLLAEGEWWKNGDTLFIKTFDGMNPAEQPGESNFVEAKRYPFCIRPEKGGVLKHTTIRGFHLFATSITTDDNYNQRTNVSEANNVKIDKLNAKYLMHTMDLDGNFQWQWTSNSGIILSGTNCELTNSTILYSAASGATVYGRKNKVLNNTFLYCNYMGTEASVINTGTQNAISEDHEIGYNNIYYTPHAAISYMELVNSDPDKPGVARIHHNHIRNSMTRYFDLGAIKGVGQYAQWVRIDHNVIHNDKVFDYGQARSGLYFDFGSSRHNNQSLYIVDHNLVFNVERGITINHLNGLKVYNNTFSATKYNDAYAGFSFYGVDRLGVDLEIKNNIHNGYSGSYGNAVLEANYIPEAEEWETYFSDTASGDFSLTEQAVNVINEGVNVAPWNDSLTGLPDIGAYEYGKTTWKAGAELQPLQASYSGTALSMPGKIEAENYDMGGTQISYYDSDELNSPGKYRMDGVDIDTTYDGEGGFMITNIEEGEWLEYSIYLSNSGVYTLKSRLASEQSGKIRYMFNDSVYGEIDYSSTGSLNNWADFPASGLNLSSGKHVMKIQFLNGGINLNFLELVAESVIPKYHLELYDENGRIFTEPVDIFFDAGTVVTLKAEPDGGYSFVNWDGDISGNDDSTTITMDSDKIVTANFMLQPQEPYGGVPWPVPGLIEAELYDEGGMNVAYYDNSPGSENTGYQPSFRNDSVDIQIASPTGCCSDFLIGWQAKGEWKEYTINVAKSGTYNIDISYAADNDFGGSMELVFNKNNASTGIVELPPTGGWNTCNRITVTGIYLEEGEQVMKSNPLSDGHNIDYVFIYDPDSIPEFTLTTQSLPAEGGTIAMDPAENLYLYQTDVVLKAIPAEGYQFDSWSGDKTANVNPYTISMIKDVNISAEFSRIEYDLTTSISPLGSGTISRDPDKTSFIQGETVSLTAVPAEGYAFGFWKGDVTGNLAGITLVMDKAKSVTAVFEVEVGIDDNMQEALKVYPNPFKEVLHIVSEGEYTYEIINVVGETLLNGKVYDTHKSINQINVSDLVKGLYFLKVTNKEDSYTYRVVKE
ncbi:MAG: InlB B-repeat-containing protein [Bacteroidota bacterium]